jgi:hypothetical protein
MSQVVNGIEYKVTTLDRKIKDDAAAFAKELVGDAITAKDCVKLEMLRSLLRNKKATFFAEAVRGSNNKKRVNRFYGEAVALELGKVEVAWATNKCEQAIEAMDSAELARRQQEAYDSVDAELGQDLSIKEYAIYGIGAAVVLFGLFYVILKRRKK